MAVKRTMYQCKVDVDILNTVKSVLMFRALFSSDEGLTFETSANILFVAFSIFTSTLRLYIVPINMFFSKKVHNHL